MIDDLDLVFGDDDGPRHRHQRADRRSSRQGGREYGGGEYGREYGGREYGVRDRDYDRDYGPPRQRGSRGGPPRRRKRKKKRSGLALMISLVLLLVLGLGGFFGINRIRDMFGAPDYSEVGAGSVVIEVKSGDSATDVGHTLYDKKVVKSVKAFINAARAEPDKSTAIQAGFFKLADKMPAKKALDALVAKDDKGVLINRVHGAGLTIPEGLSVKRTLKLLSDNTKIPLKNFEDAAKDPIKLGVPASWFSRQDGTQAKGGIEGFLFPDTYEFPKDATADAILKTMVQRFLSVTDDLSFTDNVKNNRHVSPYEALIVASLAQAESGNIDDLGKIARVAYNRVYQPDNLKEPFYCGCLQMDVTVNYWLEKNNKPTKPSGQMTAAELNDPKNPYNGNLRGLPPGPIDNPGKAALQAAMDPPAGNWLYFVATGKADGSSLFADTLSQHRTNCRSVGTSC